MERRVAQRYELWFPLWLASDNLENGLAIGQDTSLTGIKVATASNLPVGSTVTVTFRLPSNDGLPAAERKARGSVVRVEANDDPHGIWPFRMVVELDEPLLEIDALLETAEPMSAY